MFKPCRRTVIVTPPPPHNILKVVPDCGATLFYHVHGNLPYTPYTLPKEIILNDLICLISNFSDWNL